MCLCALFYRCKWIPFVKDEVLHVSFGAGILEFVSPVGILFLIKYTLLILIMFSYVTYVMLYNGIRNKKVIQLSEYIFFLVEITQKYSRISNNIPIVTSQWWWSVGAAFYTTMCNLSCRAEIIFNEYFFNWRIDIVDNPNSPFEFIPTILQYCVKNVRRAMHISMECTISNMYTVQMFM